MKKLRMNDDFVGNFFFYDCFSNLCMCMRVRAPLCLTLCDRMD